MPINPVGGLGAAANNPISDAVHQFVTTVQAGDTNVADLAKRLGVEIKSILQENPHIKDPHQRLNVGQEIRLPQGPAAASQPGQTTAAEKVAHSEFTITKLVDKATPKLYEAATSAPAPLGDSTTKAVIQGQLSATRLSETDLAQVQGSARADGSLDAGIHFKYDIKANKEG